MKVHESEYSAKELTVDFRHLVEAERSYRREQINAGMASRPIQSALSAWRESPSLGKDLTLLQRLSRHEITRDELTDEQFALLCSAAGGMWATGIDIHLRQPVSEKIKAFEDKYGLRQQSETGIAVGALVTARRVSLNDASRMRYRTTSLQGGPKLTRRQPDMVEGVFVGYNLNDQTITLNPPTEDLRLDPMPRYRFEVPILSPDLVRVIDVQPIPSV